MMLHVQDFKTFKFKRKMLNLEEEKLKIDFEEHKQSLKNKDTHGHTGILSDIKSAHTTNSGAHGHGRVQS